MISYNNSTESMNMSIKVVKLPTTYHFIGDVNAVNSDTMHMKLFVLSAFTVHYVCVDVPGCQSEGPRGLCSIPTTSHMCGIFKTETSTLLLLVCTSLSGWYIHQQLRVLFTPVDIYTD